MSKGSHERSYWFDLRADAGDGTDELVPDLSVLEGVKPVGDEVFGVLDGGVQHVRGNLRHIALE